MVFILVIHRAQNFCSLSEIGAVQAIVRVELRQLRRAEEILVTVSRQTAALQKKTIVIFNFKSLFLSLITLLLN